MEVGLGLFAGGALLNEWLVSLNSRLTLRTVKLLTRGEACRSGDQPWEQLHFSVLHYFVACCHWVGKRHPPEPSA